MSLTYSPKQSDRRQGLRIPQNRPVKLFHPLANRYIAAQTLDLSPTGLRLSLPTSTPVATGALLQIHVANTVSSPLASKRSMIPARVVWLDRTADALQIGLQYVSATSTAISAA
ncbi:MAG TPA: PilZ domain-containing protein [Tepidisphaeraceae bacterium]|jgi:hypothetical protein|nr:PilZ domain-containing protein [Tepidisphaeraceae bacterium]